MNKHRFLCACAAAIMATAASPASASVITFDNLPSSDFTFLSAGYHGLEWGGSYDDQSWIVSSAGRGWFGGTECHSGNNFAWSNAGSALVMAGASDFSLYGFWARNGVNTLTSLAVVGYEGDTEVARKSFALNGIYRYITLNFSGVDSVRIIAVGNTLIDDINVSTIPEPATYAMLLAGLGLLGRLHRRPR